MSENTEIQKYVESEAFKAMIHNLVKGEFKEIMGIVSLPFLGVTVPLMVLLGYFILNQFEHTTQANTELAKEINTLSQTVAKLEGRLSK